MKSLIERLEERTNEKYRSVCGCCQVVAIGDLREAIELIKKLQQSNSDLGWQIYNSRT